MSEPAMSSNRSYLLRAMYEWISDNGLTPYLLVDANAPAVRVPRGVVKDGRVVLNVAARAVTQLDLGREYVRFLARFGGVSQVVEVPMGALLAIYAQENGQGMMFPAEDGSAPPPIPETEPPPAKKGPSLRVVK
ncbi:ClpXP protease specificity-enhancing factor [Pseudolysobacter antarcticus]|uniref:ClpXP protease specificity-enhancing factor n=1 Tax=Pseudolysobacter antarcticus TaxID=2511995 RepID=A0A411HH26_9GAMM|nr:ClpXP protease specificity-enhancing factor [Pseudolysobacter antarcticus]QBB69818.1 ClpXP protease specificity-enhancing factor [Pseudolysobacter antarcticus]